MSATTLNGFNTWIGWALDDARKAVGFVSPAIRRIFFDGALLSLSHALTAANQLGCRARKALCLRVMNWIRADLRSAS
jgi:hypothetical protein